LFPSALDEKETNMTATILNGRELAKKRRAELSDEVAEFKAKYGFVPTIAVLRVGEDPASLSYSKSIEKGFGNRGMGFALHTLPETATQEKIVALVAKLNADESVHGIMVQEPLPKGIDEAAVKDALSPDKDVDGVHPVNAGRLAQVAPVGRPLMVGPFFVPATPAGGLEILKQYEVALQGKHAVVVGRSNIVGKPMAMLLLRENATVTMCHSRTVDLASVCRSADILCAAVGRARMIKGDWIRPGAVVIDFGVNFVDGEMFGDVDFETAQEVAGMITPVPGGTGPMTNVMLMRNVIEAARRTAGA
jgi:methylenetetrahydrofolate dehydrogenase (NADP+)/methenyltetrahydrofolate cyclohydrolase